MAYHTNPHIKLVELDGVILNQEDAWCDPSCLFLVMSDNYNGYCSRYQVELDYYDFYLAICRNNYSEE